MHSKQNNNRIRNLERFKITRRIEKEISDGNFRNINFFLENSKSEGIYYALEMASFYGNLSLVKEITRRANINSCKYTALHMASENGHFDVIVYLMESGIFDDLSNSNVLMIAVENNHFAIVEYILSKKDIFGAKFCDINAHYDLALRTAIEKENFEMVRLLIEHGADVNVLDKMPIELASKLDNKKIFDYLQKLIDCPNAFCQELTNSSSQ
jgi:ankyrin repeat protein